MELFLVLNSLLLISDSNLVDFQLALSKTFDLRFVILGHVFFSNVVRDSFNALNYEFRFSFLTFQLSNLVL